MSNVLSGARTIFYVDGKKIGYAFGVNVDEEITYEPIEVLDRLAVQEHVPVGYRTSMGCEFFRTISGINTNTTTGVTSPNGGVSKEVGEMGSLKQMGLFPKVGLDDRFGLVAPEMTSKLIDNLSGKLWKVVEGVKAEGQGFAVRARGVIGVNVRFVCIRARDESEVQ